MATHEPATGPRAVLKVAPKIVPKVVIVGEGPLRAELGDAATSHGVADRVRFAGRVGQDDILPFYADADVFALSSFAEGIPVVLMEAMATQLPVVASGVNGIRTPRSASPRIPTCRRR